MEITSLDLFDLYGDGTLVMLTHTDESTDDLRYAWYIKKKGINVHKVEYQRNPYQSFQLDSMESYVVKAFVRNGKGEKAELEQSFKPTKKTSPQLAQAALEEQLCINPVAEQISGGFWQLTAREAFEKNAKFAWYLYRAEEPETVVRSPYMNQPDYIYKFEAPGTYRAKLFVVQNGKKYSRLSDAFTVTV